MTINNYVGTGRARCKNCKKIIPKGSIGVEFKGYRISDKYCYSCIQGALEVGLGY